MAGEVESSHCWGEGTLLGWTDREREEKGKDGGDLIFRLDVGQERRRKSRHLINPLLTERGNGKKAANFSRCCVLQQW